MKHPPSSRTSFRYANPLQGAASVARQSRFHGACWLGLLHGPSTVGRVPVAWAEGCLQRIGELT